MSEPHSTLDACSAECTDVSDLPWPHMAQQQQRQQLHCLCNAVCICGLLIKLTPVKYALDASPRYEKFDRENIRVYTTSMFTKTVVPFLRHLWLFSKIKCALRQYCHKLMSLPRGSDTATCSKVDASTV